MDNQAINIEQKRLSSLINSMTDGVIATDKNGSIEIYNGASLSILDMNKSINGLGIKEVLNIVDKNNEKIDIMVLLNNSNVANNTEEYFLQYSDGSRINLFFSIAPVHLGYGSEDRSGYVIVLRDISRQKALEEERDDFISVVSHELRNPVAIVEGNLSNAKYIIDKNQGIPTVKHALDQAYEQVAFLSNLIEDLATLSRAERNVLKLEPEPINVEKFIQDLANNYQNDAESKGLKFNIMTDPQLELLNTSPLYVREILQNFITNSIKYTEAGSITLSAKQSDGSVIFTVSDTGIGISTADKNRLFDKFFRSDDHRTRKVNGTGLGLYVTMELINLIGAKIEVDSELNRGSNFILTVPDIKS